MKRGMDRDVSPYMKRSRSSIGGGYLSGSDHGSPDRRRLRSPSPPPKRYSQYHREFEPMYKILCVGGIHPKASDEGVRDALYREFKKFGDVSVKIVHDVSERLAYVYFRTYDDASDAMHSKPRILFYDKPAFVEPVYEKISSEYRRRSPTPEYGDRYLRHRSPAPPHYYDERPPRYVEYEPYGRPRSSGYPPDEYMREGGPQVVRRSKKDRFPNYLHHVQPEDDPLATRTLFAGNLEINISDEELQRIFSRYGDVEDIDVKRPPPGTGNAFAFIRYENLDQAHRAKIELSGQYIGKFQCKIGYGKPLPSHRVWVGGLGSWTSVSQLEREFDRFGAIRKIEYAKGDAQSYIFYETIEAAKAAVAEMRGFPLGGQEFRIRVDFADDGIVRAPTGYVSENGAGRGAGPTRGRGGYRGRGRSSSFMPRGRGRGQYSPYGDPYSPYEGGKYPGEPHSRSRSRSPVVSLPRPPGVERSMSPPPTRPVMTLEGATNLTDVARAVGIAWHGGLILKSSYFGTKFYQTDGDTDVADNLLKDENGEPLLRITQRLRIEQSKLDDVSKRIASSPAFGIFLALPGGAAPVEGIQEQQRPLKNLVSYLKQKEAAGVISLQNRKTGAAGVLYAFPPCDYGLELLKRTADSLTSDESMKDDHLVIVCAQGSSAI